MKVLPLILGLSLLSPLGAAGAEVMYEVFSMPLSEAAKLRRERLGGDKSYERILEMLKKKEVKLEAWMAEEAALMGTISPPRELQKDGEKVVWLAFVTVAEARK